VGFITAILIAAAGSAVVLGTTAGFVYVLNRASLRGFDQKVTGYNILMKDSPFSSDEIGALVTDAIDIINEAPENVDGILIEWIKGRMLDNGTWDRHFHRPQWDDWPAGDYVGQIGKRSRIRVAWIPGDRPGNTALAYEIIRRHFRREPYKDKYAAIIAEVKNKHRDRR
jgi:hypothetical protein